MHRRPVLTALAAMSVAVVLAACGQGGHDGGQGGTSAPARDGTLTYALGDEPETFNPGLQDEHTDPVTELVFRGLTRRDADNKVVPALAESWQIAKDGRSYTFRLRKGLTWHDGKPVTSDDVAFTIETVKAAGADSPLARNFTAVTSVTAPDATTVRLELERPFAPMLDAMAMAVLPKHVLNGKKITDPDFGRQPVGAGPFRLTAYKPGQYAELRAFGGYYEGAPGLKKIIIKYVPDDSARLIQLANGEVDAANLAPQQAAKVRGKRLEVYPTADYRALMFNLTNPRFADKRVRQAMNHAVNRDAITESVVLGYGTPAKGPLDTTPYASAPGFAFDPARVTALMTEAGYARDGQGLWARNGSTLRFELSTFAEDSLRVAILNVAATQLRQQGFDVVPTPRPRDWVRRHWSDLEVFVVGWGTPYDPDTSVYGPFHSSEALAEGGSNFGSYDNPAADKALEDGRGTLDPDRRKAAYDAFQQALQDDPPFVWISYLKAINAVPDDLAGPQQRTLGHHGYGFFWNAETWRYR